MNETDLWVQWWSLAWRHAHPGWQCGDDATWHPALTRNRHACASKVLAIEPCLPCRPTPALLHLTFASPEQKDFIMALANCICRPAHPGPLDATAHLWCQRLAGALHTSDWLNQSDDVLHLLKAWVEPPVWQRLRLCFAPGRIMALEPKTFSSIAPSRLDVFWHAVLWRAHLHSGDDDADSTQN